MMIVTKIFVMILALSYQYSCSRSRVADDDSASTHRPGKGEELPGYIIEPKALKRDLENNTPIITGDLAIREYNFDNEKLGDPLILNEQFAKEQIIPFKVLENDPIALDPSEYTIKTEGEYKFKIIFRKEKTLTSNDHYLGFGVGNLNIPPSGNSSNVVGLIGDEFRLIIGTYPFGRNFSLLPEKITKHVNYMYWPHDTKARFSWTEFKGAKVYKYKITDDDKKCLPTDSDFEETKAKNISVPTSKEGFYRFCLFVENDEGKIFAALTPLTKFNKNLSTDSGFRFKVAKGFVQAEMSNNVGIGIGFNGELYAWGTNQLGLSGTDRVQNTSYPTAAKVILSEVPEDERNFVDVDAGAIHTCALSESQKLYCWGYKQVFNGEKVNNPLYAEKPELVAGDIKFKSIASMFHANRATCGITIDDELACMGVKTYNGTNEELYQMTVVFDESPVVDFDLGEEHGCLITESHEVHCWGRSKRGSAGQGSTGTVETVTKILGSVPKAKRVGAGRGFTLVLTEDGDVYGFGTSEEFKLMHKDPQAPLSFETVKKVPYEIPKAHFPILHLSSKSYVTNEVTLSWGKNDNGMAGVGKKWVNDVDHVEEPTNVVSKNLNGLKIVLTSESKWNQGFLTEEGTFHVAGRPSANLLGTTDDKDSEIPAPKIEFDD